MKKIILILLSVVLMTSLASCSSDHGSDQSEQTDTEQSSNIEKNPLFELDLDGITTLEDLETHIEKKLDTFISDLNDRFETLKSEIDSYEKYTSDQHRITEFYQTVIKETEQVGFMLCEYTAVYAQMILDADMSMKDKYNAVEGIHDLIYEDAFDEIHDEIYDGILDDMYDTFYDGILDDAQDEIAYDTWYSTTSNEYDQWYEASSEVYDACYETASDIYSFSYDLASELYDKDIARAEKRLERFLSKIDRMKESVTDQSASNIDFNTTLRTADNTEELEIIVYKHVSDCTQASFAEWNSLSSEINTFDKYVNNIENIEQFHARIENASSQILKMICDYSSSYAKMLLNSSSSNKEIYKDFELFSDIFYDEACDIVKEEIYEDLLKEIKDYYYEGIIYDAKDNVPYSKWSDARSHSYSLWSDSRSAVYDEWSKIRSELYHVYTDIRSEVYRGEINKALDKLQDFIDSVSEKKEITSTKDTQSSSGEIRSDFKEAMDSYEAFFDEYIAFMTKYYESDTDDMLSMMTDYTNYMTQYTETLAKLDSLDTDELSDEEALYYAEVTSRITSKLLEAGV